MKYEILPKQIELLLGMNNYKNHILLAGFDDKADTVKLIRLIEQQGIVIPAVILSRNHAIAEQDLCNSQIKFLYENEFYSPEFIARYKTHINLRLTQALSQHYPFILRSMERWISTITNIDDRIFHIDKLFCFFVDLLDKNNIEAVIYSTGTAHHYYNLVLFLACEYRGIESVFHMTNPFTNRVRFVKGLDFRTIEIDGRGSDNGEMRKYLDNIAKDDSSSAPWRVKEVESVRNKKWYFYTLILPKYFARVTYRSLRPFRSILIDSQESWLIRYLKMSISLFGNLSNLQKIKNRYTRNCRSDVQENALVIYAHFQPEATSHPDGGFYPDMRYWIDYFKNKYTQIYYKEHIGSFLFSDGLGGLNNSCAHRSMDYYDDLEGMGASFLDVSYPTKNILNKSGTIFTLSGTVILEGSLMGGKVIYAGTPWFGHLPTSRVNYAADNVELRVLENISHDTICEYFAELEKHSFPNILGWATSLKDTDMPLEEYSHLIVSAIKIIMSEPKSSSTRFFNRLET